MKLPEESFARAYQLEFQVKSVQNKVENDFACQNIMLVYEDGKGRNQFLSYPAPITTWETRRVDLSAAVTPGFIKAIGLGANPRGTKCSFWIRGLRLLKNPENTRDGGAVAK